jgi:hypothetical protein
VGGKICSSIRHCVQIPLVIGYTGAR